nr:MAG TPA: baseplate protein [Caudoviricetes sp.]
MKTITDGSATFAVRDKRMSAIVDMFYPVGSVYMSANPNKTKADFLVLQYGTWEEVPAASCLETADASHAAGSTVSAGLPNLTGTYDAHRCGCYGDGNASATGVFAESGKSGRHSGAEGNWSKSMIISFNASKSNSIYGASTTVQPKAFFVKAWRRTA